MISFLTPNTINVKFIINTEFELDSSGEKLNYINYIIDRLNTYTVFDEMLDTNTSSKLIPLNGKDTSDHSMSFKFGTYNYPYSSGTGNSKLLTDSAAIPYINQLKAKGIIVSDDYFNAHKNDKELIWIGYKGASGGYAAPMYGCMYYKLYLNENFNGKEIDITFDIPLNSLYFSSNSTKIKKTYLENLISTKVGEYITLNILKVNLSTNNNKSILPIAVNYSYSIDGLTSGIGTVINNLDIKTNWDNDVLKMIVPISFLQSQSGDSLSAIHQGFNILVSAKYTNVAGTSCSYDTSKLPITINIPVKKNTFTKLPISPGNYEITGEYTTVNGWSRWSSDSKAAKQNGIIVPWSNDFAISYDTGATISYYTSKDAPVVKRYVSQGEASVSIEKFFITVPSGKSSIDLKLVDSTYSDNRGNMTLRLTPILGDCWSLPTGIVETPTLPPVTVPPSEPPVTVPPFTGTLEDYYACVNAKLLSTPLELSQCVAGMYIDDGKSICDNIPVLPSPYVHATTPKAICNITGEIIPFKLTKIASTDNGITIETNNGVYVSQYDNSPTNTKYHYYNIEKNTPIGNYYPIEEFEYQNIAQENKYDELNPKAALGVYKCITQFKNSTVMMQTDVSTGGHWKDGEGIEFEDLSIAVYDTAELSYVNMSQNYHTDNKFSTRVNVLSAAQEDELSTIPESRFLIPPMKLSGFTWDFMNITTQDEPIDFDNGNAEGVSFKMKTPYNLGYDIDTELITELKGVVRPNETTSIMQQTVLMTVSGSLLDTRKYIKINNNKNLWASYKVGNCYLASADTINTLRKGDLLCPRIVEQVLHKTNDVYAYEQVENIKGIRTGNTNTKHKSNIYSIRLTDTGLNDNLNNIDTNLKKHIQAGIESTIRNICEKYSPSHTKLWKIIWVGK